MTQPQELELPRGVKLVRTIEGHEDLITCIAFDPTGRTLTSGSNDATVRLWDVVSGKLLRTMKGRSKPLAIA